MPKRTDIKKVLVIGSGPIVIGQAAEFDYAGTQACLALKEEGYEVVLCNSNPATIMTDKNMADKIYLEPLTVETVKKIIEKRQIKPIETTFELKDIITSCYPPKDRNKPALANKVFQAIRIEVNGELDDLDSLEDMIGLLNKGGRLCVITFHPLEDRIAKNLFKLHSTGCLCPPKFPKCVCGHKADISLVSKKPIMPSEEELLNNSRSASAKLRVIEKI